MTVATESQADLEQARLALIEEWEAVDPRTPEQIADFYLTSERLVDELRAWHEDPARQAWTAVLQHVARQIGAKTAVDVGCGAGFELEALKAAGIPDLWGVEPNERLFAHVAGTLEIPCVGDVDDKLVPIDTADLLVCFDVLEHIVNPESWLASWASRAKLGAVLVETTATHDIGTPLHLEANRGWHPGRCLESLGWELLDSRDRLHVWQRMRLDRAPSASILMCAYRACSLPTMNSLLALQAKGWRISTKWSDGLISRARAVLTSIWWRETADDVFLMVDDDIVFEPSSAERLVRLCREGYDIVHAAYPVRDGGHLAIRGLHGDIEFGPDAEPVEIRHASTGFLAVHRRVLDAMHPTVPLCHGNQTWSFWPVWQPFVIEDDPAGGHNYLSEDWAFCERARQLGFKVWLDPTIKLGHLAQVEVNVVNMDRIDAALRETVGAR